MLEFEPGTSSVATRPANHWAMMTWSNTILSHFISKIYFEKLTKNLPKFNLEKIVYLVIVQLQRYVSKSPLKIYQAILSVNEPSASLISKQSSFLIKIKFQWLNPKKTTFKSFVSLQSSLLWKNNCQIFIVSTLKKPYKNNYKLNYYDDDDD